MSNEAFVTGWKNPAARDQPGPGHPAGDIRLPQESAAGRRARLLAGLGSVSCDDLNTVDITTLSMSWA